VKITGTRGQSGSGENPGKINEKNPFTKEEIKEIIKPIYKVAYKERL